jgi:hypothetical protein
MDFGGPKGSLLASLQQIVAIMFGYPSAFLGFRFVYDDGKQVFFGDEIAYDNFHGEHHCIDVSFPINGAQGERVSRVEVNYYANGQGLYSIQVS